MLAVNHTYGFFSFCSRLLEEIIIYFNKYKRLPEGIDTTSNLTWYKPAYMAHEDIFHHYFTSKLKVDIVYTHPVIFNNNDQYVDFKTLNFRDLLPFIDKYFSRSEQVLGYIYEIEYIYKLYDYENLCCIFYRGNDKNIEMDLGSYDEFIAQGKAVLQQNPNVHFLIQSDETQFLECMAREFPNHTILHSYIRHIPKCGSQVDKLDLGGNNTFQFSKYYVAITQIMSKCKTVICNSGNCALWIVFFRGHANGIQQYLNGQWV
jgi:hypothetical protein